MSSIMTWEKSECWLLQVLPLLYTAALYRWVAEMGGKSRVMQLMSNENPDVRYHALMSVQQLVSQSWITA